MMDPTLREAIIREARELYQDDLLQIDDDAKLSETGEGTWVQAWVWVPGPEADA